MINAGLIVDDILETVRIILYILHPDQLNIVMPPKHLPIVLSIAGHDPSGGAGIQADIETISALGCHPATAVTCLTVQDSRKVYELIEIKPELTQKQAEAVLADYPVKAIKIGLIGTADMAAMLGRLLKDHPGIPVVLDPVLGAGDGTELAGERLIEEMVSHVIPRTTLITPNSIEARRLTGENELNMCARELLAMNCAAVLITGTHEETEQVTNTFFRANHAPDSIEWPRLPESYHGSGCTIASASAAYLALGKTLQEAVSLAQEYTWKALASGWCPGRGQYLPNRFHADRM